MIVRDVGLRVPADSVHLVEELSASLTSLKGFHVPS